MTTQSLNVPPWGHRFKKLSREAVKRLAGKSMMFWPRTVGLVQQSEQRDEANIVTTRAGESFIVKQCTSPSLIIPVK